MVEIVRTTNIGNESSNLSPQDWIPFLTNKGVTTKFKEHTFLLTMNEDTPF